MQLAQVAFKRTTCASCGSKTAVDTYCQWCGKPQDPTPVPIPYNPHSESSKRRYRSPGRVTREPDADLLAAIEQFLQLHNMTQTAFGSLACNRPNLVTGLRNGAVVTHTTKMKIEAFIESFDGS